MDALTWLKNQTPEYDWNLKGDPQGITLTDLLTLSLHQNGPFSDQDGLSMELSTHREWFHITDDEGRQLNSTDEIISAADFWISRRQTPWAS